MPDDVVKIELGPKTPEDIMGTLYALAMESDEISKRLAAYFKAGDINDLRRVANSLLVIRTMETQQALPFLMATVLRSEHPVSQEARETLARAVEADNAA